MRVTRHHGRAGDADPLLRSALAAANRTTLRAIQPLVSVMKAKTGAAILFLIVGVLAHAETDEQRRRRAPPPPPLPAATYEAYEFRFRLLGNGDCLPFAQQADAVMNDTNIADDAKVAPLRRIGNAARAADCLIAAPN